MKYGNLHIAKFINYIMKKGKKNAAQKIVYRALDEASKKNNITPVEVFEEAIKNVSPALEVRSKRVGGANYQVPFPVRIERKFALACRWIIEAANGRKGVPMAKKLAEEISLAAKNNGNAVKKRNDVQRMAEANRAFAHFAR